MVLVDAVARRLPGALARGARAELESFSPELERRARVPALHAAGRVPRLERARRAALRRPRRIDEWRREQSRPRSTCGERTRSTGLHRGPAARPWRDRDRLDRHDRRRGRDRARDQGVGREPVPDPVVVDGADAALRAARRSGCEARYSDRVLANRFIYHFRDPQRGDIVVFHTPPQAARAAAARAARS